MQSIDRRGVLKILGAAGLAAAGVAGASKLNAGENADIRANILIIGGGGREYAIGLRLREDKNVLNLYFAPGNGATKALGKNLDL